MPLCWAAFCNDAVPDAFKVVDAAGIAVIKGIGDPVRLCQTTGATGDKYILQMAEQ